MQGNDTLDQIVHRLRLLQSSQPITEFVIGGSAALMLHGLSDRQSLHDIDVYNDQPKSLVDTDPSNQLEIDLTNSSYFWGQINIGDIKKSPLVFQSESLRIRALSPETMFIHKADCAREKDIEDVALLSQSLDPCAILRRMAELKAYNAYDTWYLAAENLLAEIQCQYHQPITLEMIDLLHLESEDAYVLNRTFGLLSHQAQKQNKSGARL